MLLSFVTPSLPFSLSPAFVPRTLREAERHHSVSITHYESVSRNKYSYRLHGLMVRRHNVVSARLRLGYRLPWQVAGVDGEAPFAECRLCNAPRSDTVEHYCLACPAVRHALPRGQTLAAICRSEFR
ncbi:hypothetical protein E2C01_044907 [Portunus trituberculatus]|uniref:Uncharacterized protein n=1 Tax=Portunus trituberculatus TaxID=210409 RepID=A0A5B7FTC5_PORTR|nr:hypothetical protein [Portunus trituberculatus]